MNAVKAWTQSLAARTARRAGYYTPFQRLFFHSYDYMFTPAQLAFLCDCLQETERLDGPVVEVGCAAGATTVFLNKFLTEIGSQRRYICIDTFTGFTPADIEIERRRGKTGPYRSFFRAYSKRYFIRTLRNNGVTRPEVFQADVNAFDFSLLPPISMCLIDVDLYRPVMSSLTKILPRMMSGGVVLVDDCAPNTDVDGALDAYTEVMEGRDAEPDIRLAKLGLIVLP